MGGTLREGVAIPVSARHCSGIMRTPRLRTLQFAAKSVCPPRCSTMSKQTCRSCETQFNHNEALHQHLGQLPACRHFHKRARTNSNPQPRRRPAVSEERHSQDQGWTQRLSESRTSPEPRRAEQTAPSEGSKPGQPYGMQPTAFDAFKMAQQSAGQPPWYPFASFKEWSLAEWVVESGISQGDTERLLSLFPVQIVSER